MLFTRKSCIIATQLACALIVSVNLTSSVNAQVNFPNCSSASSDADGDGWGWENNRSCRVVSGAVNRASDQQFNASSFPICSFSTSDPDGDGYGWENNRTCVIGNSSQQSVQQDQPVSGIPVCASAASDPDGDGYGWENGASCTVTSSATRSFDQSSSGQVAKTGQITVNDITDVVLVTGQSNVLGSGTEDGYNRGLDQPHNRVLAYTNSGWQEADLFQAWDRFQHPGNQASTKGIAPNNSFAFHFGKTLASRDPSRVVAFIVVPSPGKGISTWDRGSALYNLISEKVRRALADIPHKFTVDAVLWHQGENDFLYEGTADSNPTGFTSEDSYEYRNYYQIKLNALIANFRSESWGRLDIGFICGETRRGEGVNRRLNELNSDSDPLTACVRATDLPKRTDDSFGSHFSASGLRTLGQRYAEAYLNTIIR